MHFTRTNGYTYVELLTVLFIIGLLVAISLGVARHATEISNTARVRTDLQMVADALDRYFIEFGEYPVTGHNEYYKTVPDLLLHSRRLINDDENDENTTFHFNRLLPVRIIGNNNSFSGNDPWNKPYMVKFIDEAAGNRKFRSQITTDTFGIETVDNGSGKYDSETTPFFILTSTGPDKEEGTDDDISYP